jgi:hypothetical protein
MEVRKWKVADQHNDGRKCSEMAIPISDAGGAIGDVCLPPIFQLPSAIFVLG